MHAVSPGRLAKCSALCPRTGQSKGRYDGQQSTCEHSSSCLDLLRTRHFPHATRVRAGDPGDPAGSQRVVCSGPLCCRHMYCAHRWPGQPPQPAEM